MKISEQEWAECLRQQDKRAITYLYDHYADVLYGVTLKIVGSEDLAQDVVQEAFVKIWKNGPQYDPKKGSIFTWALNITRNLAIDKTRSAYFKQRTVSIAIEDTDTFLWARKDPKSNPDHIGLQQEVDRLDTKYQQVIDLIYFRGYTQTEVKELLNIPLGTVKSRVRIGLRQLRKVFTSQRMTMLLLLMIRWLGG